MFTRFHAQVAAIRLGHGTKPDASLARSFASSRLDLQPHQVDAALAVLASPLSRGTILADEVGLGKTIEAGVVIAQRWAERRPRILLIVPASLRSQWNRELFDKFGLATTVLDTPAYNKIIRAGLRPFGPAITIMSYQFAASKADQLSTIEWDLVVIDEAHKLRNVMKNRTGLAQKLKDALASRHKILLTATPFQNSLDELAGLVSFIDEDFFGGKDVFALRYGGRASQAMLADLGRRLAPIYVRHLRRDVQAAGHVALLTVPSSP